MKMKTFSKIMALALTAVMTTSLTACEDENVPAYGTGIISDTNDTGVHHQIVTQPRQDEPEVTQGADFKLINAVIEQGSDGEEYIVLYTGVTNLTNEERSVNELISVGCQAPNGAWLAYCWEPLSDYDINDLDKIVGPGESTIAVYAMLIADVESVQVFATDISSREDIFETTLYLTEE